jgi:hypothetical protein
MEDVGQRGEEIERKDIRTEEGGWKKANEK